MKRAGCLLMVIFCLSIISASASGATFTSNTVSGNWGSATSWTLNSGTDVDGIPDSDDDVTIRNGDTITVIVNSSANSIIFATGGSNSAVNISGSNSLTIGSDVTLNAVTSNNNNFSLDVAGGTLLVGGTFTFNGGGGTGRVHQLRIGSGTATIAAIAFASNTTLNRIIFTGGSGTLSTAAGLASGNTLTTVSGSTVEFTGGTSQNIGSYTFQNLRINKSSGINNTTQGAITVNGNLAIDGGGLLDGGNQITGNATGTLSIASGAVLRIGSAASATSFPTNFTATNISLNVNSTVIYNAGVAQNVSATPTYGNLQIGDTNNSTKSLQGTTTVSGNLTINSGAGNTLSAGANTLNLAGTWTNNGTFSAVTGSLNFTGSLSQSILGGATSFNNLTVSNSAGVALGVNITVNGLLDLASGDIATGSNTLFQGGTGNGGLGSSATGTFDVVGNVNRTDASIGTARSYGNVSIQLTQSVATGTSITVNLTKTTPSDFANAATRTYTITKNGGTLTTATVRLRYKDSELNGNTEGTLELWRKDGATWNSQSADTRDGTNNWVEKGLITAFSPWVIAGPAGPTEVLMAQHAAYRQDTGKVLLKWETGYEVDNLGFNIYRQEGTERVKVNRSLIAGSALLAQPGTRLTAGKSYAWQDLSAGENAFYWLEEIDLKGHRVWHGPIYVERAIAPKDNSEAAFEQAMTLIEMNADATQQTPTLPVERTAKLLGATAGKASGVVMMGVGNGSNVPGNAARAVKLLVKHEGLYRVSKSELVAAGLNDRADSRLLQLFVDGVEQPINVIGDEKTGWSAIEFYGIGLDTPSTDTRVYWLKEGSAEGKRIGKVGSGNGQPGPSSFQYAVERKDRLIYVSGIRNGESENFWGTPFGSSPIDQVVNVPHVDQSGKANLEVALQGLSLAPHHVTITLNGMVLGTIDFDGHNNQAGTFSLPPGLLQEGQNTVTLAGQADAFDVNLVDRIRVTYSHTHDADGDVLKLTAEGAQQVTVGGFTSGDIRVMDVTDPNHVEELVVTVTQEAGGYNARFVPASSGTRILLALASDQIRALAGLLGEKPSSWRTKNNQADLVIVTHGNVMEDFKPLQTLRQSKGMKVALVDVEDIYDEFSYGNKTPQSIKDFLAFARSSWKKQPKFVLFAGGASYDPRNYNGNGGYDLVPTKFVDTVFMETASDDWFVDFNHDGLPELAVGRLPANDANEADVMVSKIIGYEDSESLNSVTLISDQNDGFNFEGSSAQLRPLIPAALAVTEIQRGQIGTPSAKSQLLAAIAVGQKIVNYAGHGSGTVWRDNVFTSTDALALTNLDRLPLFVGMTCLNGSFQFPGPNLAPALLKATDGGAIAVWTSSGLTAPALGQPDLNQEFYRLLFGPGAGKGVAQQMTLGEAAVRAKSAVTNMDIRRTWILFGDPTTKLK